MLSLYACITQTGGILRGRALDNASNAADNDDALDVFYPIPGKILVYSSNQDPSNLTVQNMKPTTFVRHDVTIYSTYPCQVAEKYSPIQSELYLVINNCDLLIHTLN